MIEVKEVEPLKVSLEQFLVAFGVRAPQMMWFLGAGASVAGGIPTAYNLTWKFKQTLFCASQRISRRSIEDLSDLAVQRRLTQHFGSLAGQPQLDSPEEYAHYFEAAYPHPGDRRTVIEEFVRQGTPSYGHVALAALMKLGRCRVVWTANFDRLIEDAAVKMLGSTSRVVVSSLDNAQVGIDAFNAERWPLIVKVHGDFQSSRLKNTVEELREQDSRMRRLLVDSCKRLGLVVMGYSGRDESVMQALREAIDHGRGYPFGLYWFHRPDSTLLPSVTQLVQAASEAGVQAHIVEAFTFDEVLGDVVKQLDKVPLDVSSAFDSGGARIGEVPLLSKTA